MHMHLWGNKNDRREGRKMLSQLMDNLSSIQKDLVALNHAEKDRGDMNERNGRLRQMNKLLGKQRSLLDRIKKIVV